MLALALVERENDPETGLPWDEVMDPVNQFAYEGKGPRVNWAARALDAAKRAYYEPLEKQAQAEKRPAPSRAGHVWRVERKTTGPAENR